MEKNLKKFKKIFNIQMKSRPSGCAFGKQALFSKGFAAALRRAAGSLRWLRLIKKRRYF
tara:strand:- start:320 stop:496 length:177 start_codon:yes stop_codon:yes gene_type:complete